MQVGLRSWHHQLIGRHTLWLRATMRWSNENLLASTSFNRRAEGCKGLMITFHVSGAITDGTRSAAERLLSSHASPIP